MFNVVLDKPQPLPPSNIMNDIGKSLISGGNFQPVIKTIIQKYNPQSLIDSRTQLPDVLGHSKLPELLWAHILQYLPFSTAVHCRLVSYRWNYVIQRSPAWFHRMWPAQRNRYFGVNRYTTGLLCTTLPFHSLLNSYVNGRFMCDNCFTYPKFTASKHGPQAVLPVFIGPILHARYTDIDNEGIPIPPAFFIPSPGDPYFANLCLPCRRDFFSYHPEPMPSCPSDMTITMKTSKPKLCGVQVPAEGPWIQPQRPSNPRGDSDCSP
ncbi:hypothetical protein DM01DRAFT_1334464 [Hesseltinella vesiculosa]|uniref:F-box domain-containing protein n=1 Tax=Hesseltinella vesiculosa TaxID=101127 RepID=A0A1X2GLX5_9FUNG|nr:hypothetical protein DM01DRAFT_1334464 [Hesseltinella vesiculosa]